MFKIFKLSTEISNPLALAGFALSVLFYIYLQILKSKKDSSATKPIIKAVLVIALVAMILGVSGWVWTNSGTTSIQGIVYFQNGDNRDVLPNVTVNILEISKRGQTDGYGKFSIPVGKEETKKAYTFQLVYKSRHELIPVKVTDSDLNNLVFTFKDTSNISQVTAKDTAANISIKYVEIKQTLPITPGALQLNGRLYYAEQMQFQVLISNKLLNSNPIHLQTMKIEAEPIILSKRAYDSLNYVIDIDKIKGFGIVKVDEYIVDISNNLKITAKLIKDKNTALSVDPDNIFNTATETNAYNLDATTDAYLQKKMNLQLRTAGAYRIRFKVAYDVASAGKIEYSPWIYVLKKS